MTMEDLSSVLWRERELLDTLLYKLEVEQLVLASGRGHWLATAAREIDVVLEQIREIELLRAVEADAVAEELGLPPSPGLRDIAERCDEPWSDIWLDHREAFTSVATAITSMSESNRDLLTAGYKAAQATLLSLSETPGTYGADGAVETDRRMSLLDRSI
ncbi:MAG TPA: flagellar protein FlgN [Nocardioidaceae bacterium]|nr:flagellar protein FlgN [Nocardioidaceae bacterium]